MKQHIQKNLQRANRYDTGPTEAHYIQSGIQRLTRTHNNATELDKKKRAVGDTLKC